MAEFDALMLIADERHRQLTEENYTHQHDDAHRADGSLALCAARIADGCPFAGDRWYDLRSKHLLAKYRDDRLQQLTIAAALIVAEMERLHRLQEAGQPAAAASN